MPPPESYPPDGPATPAATRRAGSNWLWDLALLGVLAGLWFGALLGQRTLGNPDEGRYTEIPREMAATGDFVTPRLNGVKYFEKPPLVYWLSALTFRQFGVNEFTARLWGGLFSVLGVLLTYGAARALYGRTAGIWAAIVLATTLIYYVLSQIMLLDMAVAVAMSGALFTFIVAVREPRGRRRLGVFLTFYTFVALATLAKGLIGIALPGAVIFCWVLLLNRWRALWPFYPVLGTVVLLAIAAPWHVMAARANPEFLQFYFVHEHWLRFTTRIHGRYEPWWFFLPVFCAGLFPWVCFAWQAVTESLAGGWKARHHNSEAWFFLIWIVFIGVFFSISQSKLIPYLLPVFPAMAVLLGRAAARLWDALPGSTWRRGGWTFVVITLLLTAALEVLPVVCNEQLQTHQALLAAALPGLQIGLVGSMVVGAVGAFLGLRHRRPRLMLGSVVLSTALFLLALGWSGTFVNKASSKPIAMALKPLLHADDRVYCVGHYAQDLPAYLGRQVSVVGYRGEMSFGIDAEPERSGPRFLDRAQFLGQWAQPGTAYAVIRQSARDKWLTETGISGEILAATHDYVLIVKRPNPSHP